MHRAIKPQATNFSIHCNVETDRLLKMNKFDVLRLKDLKDTPIQNGYFTFFSLKTTC